LKLVGASAALQRDIALLAAEVIRAVTPVKKVVAETAIHPVVTVQPIHDVGVGAAI
jgi:hypothetical protein